MRTPILIGKSISKISKKLNRSGSTWPGHIALMIDSGIIEKILRKNPHLQIVLIAGTNGKTTTAKFMQDMLESEGFRVFRNASGANLLNGIASNLIHHSTHSGKIYYDTAIFEIDENTLPLVLNRLERVKNKTSIIILNLFRDQLDRYGEVNTIANKWLESLKAIALKPGTNLIINGDDPMLRYIGENSGLHVFYFGLEERFMAKKNTPHDVDFLFCPRCKSQLSYSKRSYSHMGIFRCTNCGFQHLKTSTFPSIQNPLLGVYNRYNTNAAILCLVSSFGIDVDEIKQKTKKFSPAFGRQEIVTYKKRTVFMILSKNPTGFNQSIEAILEQSKNPNVLLLLNDRTPDGRDVSWIWDVEFENLSKAKRITISGDRAYDMALRIKYAGILNAKTRVDDSLARALNSAISALKSSETLYVLATYSAMLDIRKIIHGRAIL